jgi:hypothetical protein
VPLVASGLPPLTVANNSTVSLPEAAGVRLMVPDVPLTAVRLPTSAPLTFNAPALSTGAHTVQLRDANGVLSNTISVTVSAALAAGAVIAPLLVSAQSAGVVGPRTVGHAFAKGDVKPGMHVAFMDPSGALLDAQLDQANLWPDGSLRMGAFSFRSAATVATGDLPTHQVVLASGAAPSGGGLSPAALAAISDWKIKATGFDLGTDAYTVLVNDILANFSAFDPVKGWGANPLGGWRLVRSGPYCTLYKAWRYLKRDSDGASHRWLKISLYLSVYPDGAGGYEFEIVAVPMQKNTYGPHPAGTIGATDPAQQPYHGAVYTLWNGAAKMAGWGTPDDPAAIALPLSGIDAHYGNMAPGGFDYYPHMGSAYAPAGAALPAPVQRLAFMAANSTPQLCFYRGDAATGGAYGPDWAAGQAYAQYAKVVSGGACWVSLTAGTSSAAPQPTNPQGGVATGVDGIQWLQLTVAFSPTQGAGSFQLIPVPFTAPGSETPLALPDGSFVWTGAANRAKLVIGHDTAYLARKTRAVPPYDLTIPLVNDDVSFQKPYSLNNPAAFRYNEKSGSWNGVGEGVYDERIGYNSLSPTKLILTPLDPVREQTVRIQALSHGDFQIGWDDERTGTALHTGTQSWPGFIANPSVTLDINHGVNSGSPAWTGLGSPGTQWYSGSYGPLVDTSHMASLWVVPYLRSAHPFFSDQGTSLSFTALGSLNANDRNPTDSTGKRRDYNFLYFWNGGINPRVQAWALRQHDTLDFLMPDGDPARPIVKDMMDGVGTYAGIIESELSGGHVPGQAASPGFNALGLLYCTDGASVTDPVNHLGAQAIHNFMYAHLQTAASMARWRGERPGWVPFTTALARFTTFAFDDQVPSSSASGAPASNMGYFVHNYSIGAQDAQGQPAYADWPTLWAKNSFTSPAAPPWPATGLNQGADWNGANPGVHGVAETGTMFIGAAALYATASGDADALRVWNQLVTRSRTAPYSGIAFAGIESNSIYPWHGHQGSVPTYAFVAA